MIKFKEHDGLIFKMLDKPVPLTADAEMPCLVRLIQDDSPMGRLNKRNYDESLNKIECATGYNKMLKMSFNNMPFAIEKFEIIGTFVKEGSAEWVFGWQICEKPKEEPQHAKEPCDAPSPESATQTPLPVSDATQYKVGDWVEWCGDQYMVESAPPQSGGRYDIRSPYDELGCSVYPENITRKLSPYEVVIHIGCLSGTVRPVSTNGTHIWFHLIGVDDKTIAIIRISCLDAPTRKLVKSLLKTQDEEK
ncbi:MAG: hypothetical protein PHX12_05870 [Proteiniphilum sp.]|nr:hypothetical protein [Proteiniphilum sp.]